MTDFTEKRKFPRLDIRIPLQYREVRGDHISMGTLTRNLSEGGFCFVIDRFLPLHSHLVIETILPGVEKPIKAVSKIAWIRKMPYGDEYEVGGQFLDITKPDRKVLSESLRDAQG
jgi:hypothetical protein